MKTKLLALFALGSLVVASASAACGAGGRDYWFVITGSVTDGDGKPLQHVEVTLESETPVYEGTTPVKSKRFVTTNDTFIFNCVSHNRNTKYTITARKEGFEPGTVSGSAPPNGQYTIRLKRSAGTSR